MTELSDYRRLVEAPMIAEYEASERAQRAEIRRLRTAAGAAFLAMCNQRDNPDDEAFQDAIDTLGLALSSDKQ